MLRGVILLLAYASAPLSVCTIGTGETEAAASVGPSLTARLNRLLKLRKGREAYRLMKTALGQGWRVYPYMLNLAISACGREKSWVEALDLLDSLAGNGNPVDPRVLHAAILACHRNNQWSAALRTLRGWIPGKSKEFLGHPPLLYTAMNIYKNHGGEKDLSNLVEGMLQAGVSVPMLLLNFDFPIDFSRFTPAVQKEMLSSCDQIAAWKTALRVLLSMQNHDPDAYFSAISALTRGSRWEKAHQLFAKMKLHKIASDDAYCKMLASSPQSQQWQKALELVTIDKHLNGDPVTQMNILAAIKDSANPSVSKLIGNIKALADGCGSTTWNYVHGFSERALEHRDQSKVHKQKLSQNLYLERQANGILAKMKLSSEVHRLPQGTIREQHTDFVVNEIDYETRKSFELRHIGKFSPEGERKLKEILENEKNQDTAILLRATVKKELAKTADIVDGLTKILGIHTDDVYFCGNKDSRAVTCQHVAMRVPKRSLALLQNLRIPNAEVGDFTPVENEGGFGSNFGNEFRIVVRQIRNLSSVRYNTSALMSHVSKNGFVNYFGEQRFVMNPANVGIAYLKRKYSHAVEGLLTPSKFSAPWHHEMHDVWQSSRDLPMNQAARLALSRLPTNHAYLQSHILKSLAHKCDDARDISLSLAKEEGEENSEMWERICRKVFLLLPWQSRQLTLRAYHSRLWNFLASERIIRYGLGLVSGDLVSLRRSTFVVDIDSDALPKLWSLDKSVNLTVRDTVSIYCAVIPMHGKSVKYPLHGVGQLAKVFMQYDGTLGIETVEGFDRTFEIFGTYRRILCRPENITLEITEDKLRSLTVNKKHIESGHRQIRTPEPLLNESNSTRSTPMWNVVIDFSLRKGGFATMLLREVFQDPDE